MWLFLYSPQLDFASLYMCAAWSGFFLGGGGELNMNIVVGLNVGSYCDSFCKL